MEGDVPRLVLQALVTGYRARDGMKDRFRSLSEYEIACRLGITTYSYVGYGDSPECAAVRGALALLQQQGMVNCVGTSGRYDAFAPTALGATTVSEKPEMDDSITTPLPSSPPEPAPVQQPGASSNAGIERRLDEIIRLLRSIERRLNERDPAGS